MPPKPRTWDGRLARQMILPLVSTPVTPNHLTTVRLIVGLACAWAFSLGGYGWTNLGALLLVLSNVIDHADGELARLSGKSSRFGHFYDLAADSLVTVLLFVGIGAGVAHIADTPAGAHLAPHFAPHFPHYATAAGTLAGISVAAIFFMRMRIEEIAGKAGTAQPSWGGFELEDILYLMPLVTLFQGLQSFLMLAAIGAPAFALWITFDYFRVMRRRVTPAAPVSKTPSRP
ncbi:CDP-alcohol phosphatidyltransferase family protein [Robbsia sp. Bb-Pol-6]|uniref:CDP-alcohol phosphatidyltransferase family protein n=1 Tax=Robbsia betulipollinis TaxID=2981849 RepID=A0ABT3ZN49_9BURK|nr:CDP-alcohol phosphatidyltransferase family protein [Robbsia betulipollinis]MCY0387946.1 CDP-alcohol phosphatidyltransferase family protein [Robbsia betulipollinis]